MGRRRRGAPASTPGECRAVLPGVLRALLLAPLLSCSSVPRVPQGALAWNTDQRILYIHGCMNSDSAIAFGPSATQGYCSCYQAGVEELHPYSWVVDGNLPTFEESEQIKRVEDRCRERVLALRGAM